MCELINNPLTFIQLKDFLESRTILYNQKSFIESDPIQIPHKFKIKEDIEIAGFLTATIAWGNRKSIINNALKLMALMDNAPYQFLMNAKAKDYTRFSGFVHRTFNSTDLLFFLSALKNIYKNHSGLENAFIGNNTFQQISSFRNLFFQTEHFTRSQRHVSNVTKGSAAKRINMFLRWMVRKDENGVDFGIWNKLKTSDLMIPLDVHSGRVARKLGLLQRKQDDWKAVVELTSKLREFDPNDPVKYDYALFGAGVFEKL
ncbi:MAG: TIGR02757 family protein [Bacteroidales bacterium]|nr:TIGR02757 family protein [Bacteroidales bacterium]